MNRPRTASRGRIVHLIDGLGHGGAERLLTQLLKGLADTGFDVSVVALQTKNGNPEAEMLRDAGIAVETLPVELLRRGDQIAGALWHLRAMRPDIIHAHLQFAGILAGLARRAFGIPSVATLHTDEAASDDARRGLRARLSHAALSRWTERVICLTEASRRAALERGLRPKSLVVLPNGIDLSPFLAAPEGRRAGMRAALGLRPQDVAMMSVAVLRPEKGIDRLVRSMARAAPECPDLKLVIVGDGPQLEPLHAQIAQSGLEARVRMTGYRTDIADLLAAADFFVLPTLADALPTVVIEAMASGLPVIASRVGGLPEMITDGVEGLLVPPDDVPGLTQAIGGLSRDAARRTAMGARTRMRAQTAFSLVAQVDALSTLYEDLMRAGRPTKAASSG